MLSLPGSIRAHEWPPEARGWGPGRATLCPARCLKPAAARGARSLPRTTRWRWPPGRGGGGREVARRGNGRVHRNPAARQAGTLMASSCSGVALLPVTASWSTAVPPLFSSASSTTFCPSSVANSLAAVSLSCAAQSAPPNSHDAVCGHTPVAGFSGSRGLRGRGACGSRTDGSAACGTRGCQSN